MSDEAARIRYVHSRRFLSLKKSKGSRIQDGHTEDKQEQQGIATEESFYLKITEFEKTITEFEGHIAENYIIGFLIA